MRKETEQKAAAVLQKEEVFAAAAKEEITGLIHHESTVLREYKKGQTVFPAHGAAHSFVLLLSGSCLVENSRKIIGKAENGSVFALETLFSTRKEPQLRLVAEEDGKALFFAKTAVEELMQKNFAVALCFLQVLTNRIDVLNGTVEAAKSSSAEAKLAQFLLKHKKAQSNEVALSPDLTKLCRQIGIGKDALNRALDRLHTAGAIGFQGGKLVIENTERLQSFRGKDGE